MIGIIGAMDIEIKQIKNEMDNMSIEDFGGIHFYKGSINGVWIVVAKSGVGKVNSAITTSLMIDHYDPKFIINTGIAGALKPVKLGSVFLANKLSYHDVGVENFGYARGQVPGLPLFYETDERIKNKIIDILKKKQVNYQEGLILTGDIFVDKGSVLEPFRIYNEALACDMEGASIAQVCFINHVKMISLRFISDILDTENHFEDYAAFEEEAANLSNQILLSVLSQLD